MWENNSSYDPTYTPYLKIKTEAQNNFFAWGTTGKIQANFVQKKIQIRMPESENFEFLSSSEQTRTLDTARHSTVFVRCVGGT